MRSGFGFGHMILKNQNTLTVESDNKFSLLHMNNLDIDECTQNTDSCDHYCTNTVGSYYCNCTRGYTLTSNGRTCQGTKR